MPWPPGVALVNPAWVEVVRDATLQVLRDCGMGEGRAGPGALVEGPLRLSDAVGVAIDLRGARRGCLILVFPNPDAASVAAGAFPLDCSPDSAEEVSECLAELANLIAGHVVNGLAGEGLGLDISPPRVLSAPEVGLPPEAEAVFVPIASSRGSFLVVLCLLRRRVESPAP